MNEVIQLQGATVRQNDDGVVLLDFNVKGAIDRELALQAVAAVRMLTRGTAPCLVRILRATGWTNRARSAFGQQQIASRVAVVGPEQLAQLGQRLFDGSRMFADVEAALHWLKGGPIVVRYDGEMLPYRTNFVAKTSDRGIHATPVRSEDRLAGLSAQLQNVTETIRTIRSEQFELAAPR
jgi:hypothetical protein